MTTKLSKDALAFYYYESPARRLKKPSTMKLAAIDFRESHPQTKEVEFTRAPSR